jgi:class 3 adenylate cyclase
VTVLFADIKGSTEIISALDSEEAQQLLDGTVKVMMEAVHRHEGTVCRASGDGITALFGVPPTKTTRFAPVTRGSHCTKACAVMPSRLGGPTVHWSMREWGSIVARSSFG